MYKVSSQHSRHGQHTVKEFTNSLPLYTGFSTLGCSTANVTFHILLYEAERTTQSWQRVVRGGAKHGYIVANRRKEKSNEGGVCMLLATGHHRIMAAAQRGPRDDGFWQGYLDGICLDRTIEGARKAMKEISFPRKNKRNRGLGVLDKEKKKEKEKRAENVLAYNSGATQTQSRDDQSKKTVRITVCMTEHAGVPHSKRAQC